MLWKIVANFNLFRLHSFPTFIFDREWHAVAILGDFSPKWHRTLLSTRGLSKYETHFRTFVLELELEYEGAYTAIVFSKVTLKK